MRLPLGPLRHRPFRPLFVGQVVSALGDWMGTVALIALVLNLTGSSTAVGGILVLQLLPSAVAGPVATRVVGRWNRRRAMMYSDLVRVGIALLIPLVRALWWVYLWAFFLQLGGLVFLPARDASIPDLVEGDEDELAVANGLILGSSFATIPVGAAAFGGLVALQDLLVGGEGPMGGRVFAIVFLVDALTFVVSYLLVRSLRVLDAVGPAAERKAGTPPAEGLPFVQAFRIPLVRTVVPVAAVVTLGIGALFSVGITFVRQVLDASDVQFGVLIALFGVGAALGLGVLQLLREREQLRVVRVSVAVLGIVVAVLSLAPTLEIAYGGAVAFGAAASATLLSGMGVLQTRLSGSDRVQGFAAFHVVIRAGLATAALAAGVAVDLISGVRWPVIGRLEPARVVLLCSGLLVLLSAGWVHEPRGSRVGPRVEDGS
ncbi:MAG: MFS transporter [Candidatus Velamenicoccus archaeovorus]